MFEASSAQRPVPAEPECSKSRRGLRTFSVGMVATSPPRRCGIATYASDLAEAIRNSDPDVRVYWAAIDEVGASHVYGGSVRWRIHQQQPSTYGLVAEQLNAADVDVVHLQHEFGLYGAWPNGIFDDHLRTFLSALRKPLVTTLHTVPQQPTPSMRCAIQRLARRSTCIIVMAEAAATVLRDAYGLDRSRLRVVPHGAPAPSLPTRVGLKRQHALHAQPVISSFGLLDPRKGFEYMIEALPDVVEQHPAVEYLIIGTTHPELARHAGETYREQLRALVTTLGLTRHVRFVDAYLSQSQLVEYLLASDVYVTPYLDPDQITSGTLAYALTAGKAIVSTRYVHALEALADRRGILVDFRSPTQLGVAVNAILADDSLRSGLEQAARTYGKAMAWPRVGRMTLDLLREAAGDPTA